MRELCTELQYGGKKGRAKISSKERNRTQYPAKNPADGREDATNGPTHGKALQSCEKTASNNIADCSLDSSCYGPCIFGA